MTDALKVKRSDAFESRCFGLVSGVALKNDLKTRVLASLSYKEDGPFFCPECLSEAIVRKCSDKEDHFAHIAEKSPTAKKGNTAFHDSVRDLLYKLLHEKYPDGGWKTELEMKSKLDGSILRPDICGYFGKRGKESPAVAVEIQCSSYTQRYIGKKNSWIRYFGC